MLHKSVLNFDINLNWNFNLKQNKSNKILHVEIPRKIEIFFCYPKTKLCKIVGNKILKN